MKRMMLCSLIIALLLPLLVACGAASEIKVSGNSYTFKQGSGTLTWHGEEEISEEDFRYQEGQLNLGFSASLLQFSDEDSYTFNYVIFGMKGDEEVDGTREGNVILFENESGGTIRAEVYPTYLNLTIRPYLDKNLEAHLTFVKK